ncbi:hypothetical protein AcV5_005357 [Taiwanofungus camphoratus]|nr:hypothetical protein AcV5_005357 [Antrodia cinnamomea]
MSDDVLERRRRTAKGRSLCGARHVAGRALVGNAVPSTRWALLRVSFSYHRPSATRKENRWLDTVLVVCSYHGVAAFSRFCFSVSSEFGLAIDCSAQDLLARARRSAENTAAAAA